MWSSIISTLLKILSIKMIKAFIFGASEKYINILIKIYKNVILRFIQIFFFHSYFPPFFILINEFTDFIRA